MLDIRSPILAKGEALRLLQEWLSLSAKMADRVLCHSIDTVARDFYGVSQHGRKVIVYPPVLDFVTEAGDPESLKSVSRRNKKCLFERGLSLVFVGNFGKQRMIPDFIDRLIEAVNAELDLFVGEIHMIGDGPTKEESISRTVDSKHKFIFHGNLDRSEVKNLLSEVDVGLAYVPNTEHYRDVEFEILEYAGMGLPIIASDTFGHRKFEAEGFYAEYWSETDKSLSESLSKIYASLVADDEAFWARLYRNVGGTKISSFSSHPTSCNSTPWIMKYIFVCLNQTLMSPGTLGTSALIGSTAEKRGSCIITKNSPWGLCRGL